MLVRRQGFGVRLVRGEPRGRDRTVLPNLSNANEYSLPYEQRPVLAQASEFGVVRDVLRHDLLFFIVAILMSRKLRV